LANYRIASLSPKVKTNSPIMGLQVFGLSLFCVYLVPKENLLGGINVNVAAGFLSIRPSNPVIGPVESGLLGVEEVIGTVLG